MAGIFEAEYKRLNKAQREAVETIEGPVMVIAGPGTGKTQVLALRIGHILKATDTSPDGILCLTFTNSGVEAMRRRLYAYIGSEAAKVSVSTFHAFGLNLIEEFHHVLGLERAPRLMDDTDALALTDRILNEHEWRYLRPRGNGALYFRDLKSLISLLIRERMSPEDFEKAIRADIKALTEDPESCSSRGARKGELKREVLTKIESLEKTLEVVEFYRRYEAAKAEENVLDYDDVLRDLVRLASESEDVRDTLRERYLYVLVDEHQDSSGVQNEFLRAVWGGVERPNVFVVGDDRQLIYGFSGASFTNFEEFTTNFPGAKVITLTDNYRSTQLILDAAETLLQSSLASGKLVGRLPGDRPLELVENEYPRDEILSAGLFFKERLAEGVPAEECALLVPKNAEVRSAARVLRDLGLPVAAVGTLRLFDLPEMRTFIHILQVLADPFAGASVAELVLDQLSGIPPLAAHEFLYKVPSRSLSLKDLVGAEAGPINQWGQRLETALEDSRAKSVYELIQYIGKNFFLDAAPDHETLIKRVEMARSLLHLALTLEERGDKTDIKAFLAYLERLDEYGEDIPLAVFGAGAGIRVMTLHSSKGLEFEAVWIAHLTERSLMGRKHPGFALPESVRERVEEKDEAAARREVYVAITRAKRFAVLSYSRLSHKGSEERLASIIESLPKDTFVSRSSAASEQALLKAGEEKFVTSAVEAKALSRAELAELVAGRYMNKKVSVTLLNNFYECPWKWYFMSFLEVPEPLSESLVFGSIVHSVLESLSGRSRPSVTDVAAAIDRAIEECHLVDERTIARMRREAEAAAERYLKNVFPHLASERATELPLSRRANEVPELTIFGKLDLVEFEDKAIRVTDFKTGRPKLAREMEKRDDEGRLSPYLRQLAMYSFLLKQAYKDKEVESSSLYFIEERDPEKTRYSTRIGAETLDILLSDITDYDRLLRSGEWVNRTCAYKPHQGQDTCPYCERAKLYK